MTDHEYTISKGIYHTAVLIEKNMIEIEVINQCCIIIVFYYSLSAMSFDTRVSLCIHLVQRFAMTL